MSSTTRETIKQLVAHHFEQSGRIAHDERVVAISASHKLHWANEAGISIEQVEDYLADVCEPVEPESEFDSVPSYRLNE